MSSVKRNHNATNKQCHAQYLFTNMSSGKRTCCAFNTQVHSQHLFGNMSSVKTSYYATNQEVHSQCFPQIFFLLKEVIMHIISKFTRNTFS